MTAPTMPIALSDSGLPQIRTLEDAFRVAEMVFQSGLAPECFKNPQAILVAWSFGAELGLSRMQSLFNIAVVGNKPAIYGKAVVGVVQSKGVLESLKEWIEGEGDNMTAVCTVKRKGFADEITKRFSVADAKRANLWMKKTYAGKDTPWVLYPKDMMGHKARARAFGILFGDVLCGLPVYEDYVESVEVLKNEKVQENQQAPAEEIDDPLMKQIGATEVPAEKSKRGRKVTTTGRGDGGVIQTIETNGETQKFEQPPVSEASALAAENANALGVPPEDIPPVESEESLRGPDNVSQPEKIETTKPVNSPGITVKPEVTYTCKACQDTKKNSKGGPCPICSPKKFDVGAKDEAHKSKEEKKESKTETIAPLKNQAENPSGPKVEGALVVFAKFVDIGKGKWKFVTTDGELYYSNADIVKSRIKEHMGKKMQIGFQVVDTRNTICSALPEQE